MTSEGTRAQASARSESDLDHANAYAQAGRFALHLPFRMPYTAQIRDGIRRQNRKDTDVYLWSDRFLTNWTNNYAILRLLTGLLFLMFLLAADWIYDGPRAGSFAFRSSGLSATEYRFLGIAAVGLAFLFIRFAARRIFACYFFLPSVRRFGRGVAGVMATSIAGVRDACDRMQHSMASYSDKPWPERAGDWCKIALWHAKRGEDLERYTAAVLWKLRVSLTRYEAVSRLAKGLLVMVCLIGFLEASGTPPQRAWIDITPAPFCGMAILWIGLWLAFFRHPDEGRPANSPERNVGFVILLCSYLGLFELWSLAGARHSEGPFSPSLGPLVAGPLVITLFWFGWVTGDEQNNAKFMDAFSAEVANKLQEPNAKGYFECFALHISQLVRMIERGG